MNRLNTNIRELLIHNVPDHVIHDWLCHPMGERCPDGCDEVADRERLAAYEAMCDNEET